MQGSGCGVLCYGTVAHYVHTTVRFGGQRRSLPLPSHRWPLEVACNTHHRRGPFGITIILIGYEAYRRGEELGPMVVVFIVTGKGGVLARACRR
ncbi:hypothetical protein TIFTF001_052340 [Ficus carica]|uniref:Uncharacterized protein n=1 Tax=Ficus carica TaxID=3494 RepID=A0AA88EG98_FICCA|nr:hypothetical protein TIFTF001_052340 [Ficus carica]